MTTETGVIIIGGGIAGAGAAYEIAGFAPVTLLEREPQFGYHATGRSAASFTENYGNGVVRRLVIASRAFLETPPAGFCEHALLAPRGLITIARADQLALLEQQRVAAVALVPSIVSLSVTETLERVSILRPDCLAAAIFEPHSRELDVSGLHQGFLRAAKARGARLLANAAALSITRRGAQWIVETPSGTFAAPVIVNAAGAWADELAGMAGIEPLGLVAKRRTAFNVPAPAGVDVRSWPMIDAVGGDLYFKPDAGQLLVSPADATPCAPTDAQPDDLDVATGVERFEQATVYSVPRVTRAWAGLRTFAADASPVVGPDETAEGFIWLAGQAGYGIKTSPALSRACAALLRAEPLPADLRRLGIEADDLLPQRLRRALKDTPRSAATAGGDP